MLRIKTIASCFYSGVLLGAEQNFGRSPTKGTTHTHDPDAKVAQLDTKRCLKNNNNTSNFSAGWRQRPPRPAPVSWIDFWTRKNLERRRASQNPERPAPVLMVRRRSNETLTLSAGHISGLKVWDGQSGEEAAAFSADLCSCRWCWSLQLAPPPADVTATHSAEHTLTSMFDQMETVNTIWVCFFFWNSFFFLQWKQKKIDGKERHLSFFFLFIRSQIYLNLKPELRKSFYTFKLPEVFLHGSFSWFQVLSSVWFVLTGSRSVCASRCSDPANHRGSGDVISDVVTREAHLL